MNPAPAGKLPREGLKKVSIITPNESEAEILTGESVKDVRGAGAACRVLHGEGVGTVILTMGARGAFLSDPGTGTMELIPGFKVQAVDTTAAGDVFNGALAASLAQGGSLIESVKFANAAAALSVTRLGAQPSAPNESEIRAMLPSPE